MGLGSSGYNNKEMSVTEIVSDVKRQNIACGYVSVCLSDCPSVCLSISVFVFQDLSVFCGILNPNAFQHISQSIIIRHS